MTEGNGVGPAGVLTPLRRNRFFYGKLMDTRHWELEQEYGIRSRRLINQLGLGSGILCGLRVTIGSGGVVCIAPGVAVDGRGREIVLGAAVTLERVDQPKDDCGHPLGEPIRSGFVTIWLCYRECGSEHTRVADGDCGHADHCVPGLLDERFWVRIGTDLPATPPGLSSDACESIFHAPPGGVPRRQVVEQLLAGPCIDPADSCVPLATVKLDDAGDAVAVGVDCRAPLYSNEEIFDLLMCLASRVDACCDGHATANAPRVLAVWPPLKGEIGEEDLRTFVGERRLEMVFERDMRDLGLDKPDSWLGVWQIDSQGVARLALERAGGAFVHVSPGAGQEGVAYDVDVDGERNGGDIAFVVMMRSTVGGDIAAADDGAALDADFAGTGLTATEREKLWGLAPDGGVEPGLQVREHLLLPALPGLPSGDGVEGGELHGAVARPQIGAVKAPPQLLTVRPAGAKTLSMSNPATADEAQRFLRLPRLQFTLTRAIAEASLKQVDGWLRAFTTQHDGPPTFGFNRVGLSLASVDVNPDSTVTFAVDLDRTAFDAGMVELLVIVRPGAAPAGAEPLGADEPHDLLDADFKGTSLAKQAVVTIFDGGSVGRVDTLDQQPTDGATLHDGAPGGLVHYSFNVSRIQS